MEAGGFLLHRAVGTFVRSFALQCCILAGLSAAILLAAAALDHTFFLPGRDVGLLEHPAIWAFLALQIALPLSIRRSLLKISNLEVGKDVPDERFKDDVQRRLLRTIRGGTQTGLAVGALCYTIGLAAFTWNSYQNQLPGVLLSFDFWDSALHPWGYWVTRVYKFYLFVWLLPYAALAHISVLIAVLGEIRTRRLNLTIELQPFHADGLGGLGFVPGLVTTPIIVTLLVCSIPVAAAFEVHRAFDVTPMMGAVLVFGGAIAAYAIPVIFLRTDILEMKRATVQKLRSLQQSYYSQISDTKRVDGEVLRQANEAYDYFEKICTRVISISNYPHFAKLLKYLGVAITPSLISMVFKTYQSLSPYLGHLLKPT